MLNREKFAKEILDITCNGNKIAVVKGEPINCDGTMCNECAFLANYYCIDGFKIWANSECVEPSVDWSKVPIDTPILVRDSKNASWEKKYFSEYRNGTVYAWADGATSWSVEKPEYVYDWKYAKLAESEESHD